MIGTRLGPYEITAKLGEGGMGEVWRATDARLKRDVAIKVLPAAFIADEERLTRFEREAQMLAQLHHPNIASIFGLEEADGVRALVLELVDGPTLGELLEGGALALDEALEIARQIAEALEAAHERGIVHRDLKPQNVKVTADGTVKVLDFGLAKAADLAVESGDPTRSPTLMNSPTLTAAGTALGVILGTAAYMAPEQAKGKAVDRRADIWAFGVVLWEMLAGRKLFAADTVAETLGHVMTREPDLAALPPATPERVRNLLRRCLVRDPKHRLQAIGDARIVLEEVAARPDDERQAAGHAPVRSRRTAIAAFGGGVAVALLVAAGVGWLLAGERPARDGRAPRRTEIVGISVVDSSGVAISPDGREIVAYDMTPSKPLLLRRSLDGFDVRPIPGSESGFNPFFSPDGRSIGFFTGQQLCALRLDGGERRCLAPATGFASGAWAPDGTIIYTDHLPLGGVAGGLWRVPSGGGERVRLTTVDTGSEEEFHAYPQVLQNGRDVLFTVTGSQSSLAVVPLAGGARRRILGDAIHGRYLRSGHLAYWEPKVGRLQAVRFDLERLAPVGPPVSFDFILSATGDAVPSFEVSDEGTLVYSSGAQFGDDFTVELVDRSGHMTPIIAERDSWAQPRVSPDGRQVLLRRAAQPDCSLWLLDLARGSLQRVALDGDLHNPLWQADGERFLVSQQTAESSDRRVLEVRLDGASPPEPAATDELSVQAEAVSPDGRFVALTHDARRERNDILIYDRQERRLEPLLATASDEDHPAFSPDGRFLAYAANDSGRSEVYVRLFPGPGGRYLVSTHGGTGPIWSRDGRELFYAEGTRLMGVEVTTAPRFAAGTPALVFESPEIVWERPRNYDVLADGSGFVVVRRGAATLAARSLRVVTDWFTELERLAPAR